MKYPNIREEELKNRIAKDYFWLYDCTQIVGNIDFCVQMYQADKELVEQESLLWAEAKKGASDVYKSLVQLILTIGKARTFDTFLPPPLLAAFDAEKIAFIPYNQVHEIFYMNDFNWNVAPSNYETKEFILVHQIVKQNIDTQAFIFNFEQEDKELRLFIKQNFTESKKGISKIRIDKNNFMVIYNKWLQNVKPSIAVNWEIVNKSGIIDGDFFLADLLSSENETLKEKLYVLLKKDFYILDRKLNDIGLFTESKADFLDKQKAHTQFWNKYERPPKQEYWAYIVERRDLLVPQDIRERKGSFFTPQIWVELSQKYLSDVLGEDWQDEYYIWDCAAGTGNLLAGLTNKYNIYASTLDKQDVDVMKDRIQNGANLLDNHVFQFDFLNDDFSKLPPSLQNIINDPNKRKKLVIYINPPYAEATTAKTVAGTGSNKAGVSTDHTANQYFNSKIGNASNEIFALFMATVYEKIPDCILGQFSTLKFISGSNFTKFKTFFQAEFGAGFIVPADSFDNVTGKFPIGFTVWNLENKVKIQDVQVDVYRNNTERIGEKTFYGELPESINKWIKVFEDSRNYEIGLLVGCPPDFQHNNQLAILSKQQKRYCLKITDKNIIAFCIYFAVRHCMSATWLNDRDQFLYPNAGWESDAAFQSDCLAFTLFHGQNRITCSEGRNHWIPFTEFEVGAQERFQSNFMTDFMNGRLNDSIAYEDEGLFGKKKKKISFPEIHFSAEAKQVFQAGRALWRYYHEVPNVNVNASLYDIKEHFQGRNSSGKMNNSSTDERYNELIAALRESLKILAAKIEPKVYEYGFLRR